MTPHIRNGVVLLVATLVAPAATGQRQLFVDDSVVHAREGNVRLHLHRPAPREVSLVTDRPWEGNTCAYYTVLRDADGRFRMYYRGSHYDAEARRATHPEVVCLATSEDGVRWTRPSLGLVAFAGSKDNNIVWDGIGAHCFTPFLDGNPECAPDARYKAISRGRPKGKKGLYVFKSPDGIRWTPMADGPVITEGAFDSQNLAFFDARLGRYREYHRSFVKGVRAIMTGTSEDFVRWTKPRLLEFGDAPKEHLYTNAILPYRRAPGLLVGFPTRYLPKQGSRTEPLFMSSRDGVHFRRWADAVIPEDAPEDRRGNRSNYMAWGLLELPGRPGELSVYATEAYYSGPDSRLRRFVYRVDGFVSVRADAAGGSVVTKAFEATGKTLRVNHATRDGGRIRVAVEGEDGAALEGLGLADCVPLSGDAVDAAVAWKSARFAAAAGRMVRLRFELRDADLFSFVHE